jgi:hypothetical protein
MHILMAILGLITGLMVGMDTSVAQGRNIQPVEHSWSVIRVVDGDTVQFAAPWVPAPIPQRISVRIFGVDTPEKGPMSKGSSIRSTCYRIYHPCRYLSIKSNSDAEGMGQIWWSCNR